ncbi:Ankyrin repeat and SAM domain-containing protein 6, partial [Gonapodya sp. JEL0774]
KIYDLLKKASLTKYHKKFADQEVDYNTFLTLTEKDLQQLGVTTFGALRRILGVIQEASAGPSERRSFDSATQGNDLANGDQPPKIQQPGDSSSAAGREH